MKRPLPLLNGINLKIKMYIQQLYTNCLAHAAYYVESEGEAMVIDPLRDPMPYIELAKERNAKIKFVLETHFHADFVSGHIDLSNKTGAVIVFGPDAKPGYRALSAFDGEEFSIGKIKVKVLHTPGHTIESSCFLLIDEKNKPCAVFTGDTLFVGDVGRPDLMSGNLDKEMLAEMLYDSLRGKIMTLPDDVIVYPGHGAGSACGKNIGKETVSSIGEQKKNNYALSDLSKKEFVKAVTSGLPVPPPYFFKDARINLNGYEDYDKVIARGNKALEINDFKRELKKGAFVIDTRSSSDYANAHIPDSVNIGLNGQFANWAGTVIDNDLPILIVADPGKEKETQMRLARIGFDNISGFLKGTMEDWKNAQGDISSLTIITLEDWKKNINRDRITILDVRNHTENRELSFEGSLHIPLNELKANISKIPIDRPVLVCCAGGYRSIIGAGLLKRNGFRNVMDLKGGLNAYASGFTLPFKIASSAA